MVLLIVLMFLRLELAGNSFLESLCQAKILINAWLFAQKLLQTILQVCDSAVHSQEHI